MGDDRHTDEFDDLEEEGIEEELEDDFDEEFDEEDELDDFEEDDLVEDVNTGKKGKTENSGKRKPEKEKKGFSMLSIIWITFGSVFGVGILWVVLSTFMGASGNQAADLARQQQAVQQKQAASQRVVNQKATQNQQTTGNSQDLVVQKRSSSKQQKAQQVRQSQSQDIQSVTQSQTLSDAGKSGQSGSAGNGASDLQKRMQPDQAAESRGMDLRDTLSDIRKESSEKIKSLRGSVETLQSSVEKMLSMQGQLLDRIKKGAASNDNAKELSKAKELQDKVDHQKEKYAELQAVVKDLKGKNSWLRELENKHRREKKNLRNQLQQYKQTVSKSFEKFTSKWQLAGISHQMVVFTGTDNKVIQLREGDSFDGITIKKIDMRKNVVKTSGGKIYYTSGTG